VVIWLAFLGDGIITELFPYPKKSFLPPNFAGHKGSTNEMLMEVIVKMLHKRFRQVFTAGLAATMLLSTLVTVASPVLMAAPVAQTLQAEEVAGVLTGGQFAKIWLGLTPTNRGDRVTITTEWDRNAPDTNGVGFFVLDQDGLSSVLNGSASVRDANLSAGSKLSSTAPDNQLGAVIEASGGAYTIVLFNDSATDANFTLRVTNATVSDDAGQVRDLRAVPVAEGEGTASVEASTAVTTTATTTETVPAVETPAPAPAAAVTTTAAVTPTNAAVTATVETTPTTSSGLTAVGGVVRAQELRGELPEQNAQHYYDLIPSERDGNVVVTLSFDPQDSSELARRLNFWVVDSSGFARFADAGSNVVLSEIAIGAGSATVGLANNERQARFTASGLGPYVVIVYNNSTVPGFYRLRVDGGVLVDDSNQSLTAQEAATGVSATGAITGTAATTATAATTGTSASVAATAGPSNGRVGEPGGTYVVQSGDTLSLITRDIYGEVGLWDELCAFNSLADCNNIEVGQELRLPTRAEIGAGIAPVATATPAGVAAAAAATATATATATEEVSDTSAVTVTTGVTTTTGITETATTTDTGASTGSSVNLIAALEAQGGFSTLIQALEAAGLTTALEGTSEFTIFAPTDAAFAKLPAGALDQLLASPTGQLTQILLFHVLPGRVASADISNGMQATTQQGKSVNFEVAGGSVAVNGATVSSADIEASNGVIHVIDTVILPPPDEAVPAATATP
jgi:uncharacterized surface protein with fasciclin (FAS1) repeats